MTLSKMIYQSPIGEISLIATEAGLIGAWFQGQKYFEAGICEMPQLQETVVLKEACQWLDTYFYQTPPAKADFLSIKGSNFRQKVWTCLQEIPYGETRSYKEIAKIINCASAQAVGGAVGHNPLSIFIPCHRVVGSDGQLTGYAGGLDKKIWLLEHEQGF
ncbi:methylated-DNA--[protein]-cysteine S-methyltransferase [Streptococcus pseudoporcinus]|nr:methylated-DNA--[protein]-cysteine S-methyltransferase [Streptococcus pseudoporcinus]VEF94374.1 methylated-DNA--protein-cysteine methyltransferase [Streptococcus pseudoporcinus]